MRVDGYKSSRSGNERKGDQNKSEDFSHAHISSRAITIPLAGPRIYDRQLNVCVRRKPKEPISAFGGKADMVLALRNVRF